MSKKNFVIDGTPYVQTKREEIEEEYYDHELLFMDEFDEAIIGVTERFGGNYAVLYSKKGIFEILTNDGMDPVDAIEHFGYNIIGSYVGDSTPIFLDDSEDF